MRCTRITIPEEIIEKTRQLPEYQNMIKNAAEQMSKDIDELIINQFIKKDNIKTLENGIKIYMNKKFNVIAGFPGVGKSCVYNDNKNKIRIIDSDSSKFDKKEFPDNYINHIKNNINSQDIILISTHESVINKLIENDIGTILVYPNIDCMEEYINRFIQRGNSEDFIKLVKNNWINWITHIQQIKNDNIILLEIQKNQYLSDVLDFNKTI